MNGPCSCVTCGVMTHVVAELDLTKGNPSRDFTETLWIETAELDKECVSCGGCIGLIFCNDRCDTRCDQRGTAWTSTTNFTQPSGIYCCSCVVEYYQCNFDYRKLSLVVVGTKMLTYLW